MHICRTGAGFLFALLTQLLMAAEMGGRRRRLSSNPHVTLWFLQSHFLNQLLREALGPAIIYDAHGSPARRDPVAFIGSDGLVYDRRILIEIPLGSVTKDLSGKSYSWMSSIPRLHRLDLRYAYVTSKLH